MFAMISAKNIKLLKIKQLDLGIRVFPRSWKNKQKQNLYLKKHK